MCDSKGILYIAIGEDYIKQAKLSAKVVKKTHPEIDITLISTKNIRCRYIDQVKPILNEDIMTNSFIKQSKISSLLKTPYEKTLYLDTDAYVINNVDDVFDMLEYVDLALAVDPTEFGLRHLNRNPDNIPEAFPEYQTGVIAYRNNKKTMSFIHNWKNHHEESNIQRDQVSFRSTMYKSEKCIKTSTLSLLYNYPVALTQRIEDEVKIIHDTRNQLKNAREVEDYSKILNDTNKERVVFSQGYENFKFYAPLYPNINTSMFVLNILIFFFNMYESLIRSVKNEGLLATAFKIVDKYFIRLCETDSK